MELHIKNATAFPVNRTVVVDLDLRFLACTKYGTGNRVSDGCVELFQLTNKSPVLDAIQITVLPAVKTKQNSDDTGI